MRYSRPVGASVDDEDLLYERTWALWYSVIVKRLCLRNVTHPPVLDARQSVVVLLGDHEGRQVGRIAGREDDGKQGPDVAEETTRHTAWVVHVHCRSEQHRPDEPERSEQREAMLCE